MVALKNFTKKHSTGTINYSENAIETCLYYTDDKCITMFIQAYSDSIK